MRDRVVVGGRRIEIVHLKFFSVYADDVSFRVTGLRLLVKNFNRALDDLILLLLIGVYQAVDVAVDVREIVQINPEQTPNQNEDWPNVISPTAFALPVADQDTQRPNQSRHADEQPENRAGKDTVTISRDLKNSDEL